MTMLMLSTAPQRRIGPKGRILAIEPDRIRAATLQGLLPTDLCDFVIAKSVDDALRAIARQVPDLVLTCTFLPPAEEAALTARLKQLPAAHLQVITMPHFIDSEEASARDGSKVLNFLKRRTALLRPGCGPEMVREQIEAYLEQAHVLRLNQSDRESRGIVGAQGWTKSETGIVRAAASVVNPLAADGPYAYRLGRAHANDRRRTRRRSSTELPTPLTVKVPWGVDVWVVDISSQGVLLETTSKITAGRAVDLQLIGQGVDVSVPARTTRSEVGTVDARGVRYRVAAVFARTVEALGSEPPATATVMPTALGDLLARVLTDVDYHSKSAGPRARFEQGLRRLLAVRDVQIRQAPVIPSGGSESVYFTVPSGSDHQPVLQAIFEPDHQPSAAEFRLLKAAASLAAVVLEFAPLGGDGLSRAAVS
jgi:CheY-like chemotaxis protein